METMRRSITPLAICSIFAVCAAMTGCGTSTPKGAKGEKSLFDKTCSHVISLELARATSHKPVPPERKAKMREACVRLLKSLPEKSAKKTARCLLSKTTVSALNHCKPDKAALKGNPILRRRQLKLTHMRLALVNSLLQAYYVKHGKAPPDLAALKLQDRATRDPWGSRIRIQKTGDRFRICSNGPDKKIGTGDDICTDVKK